MLLAPPSLEAARKKAVGGPCTYEEFGGLCTAAGADAAGRNLFTFVGVVRERNVELAGNALMEGMSLKRESIPCKLEFLKEGSCTPCVFSIGECGPPAWELFREKPKKRGRR